MAEKIKYEEDSEVKTSDIFSPSQTLYINNLIQNEVRSSQKSITARILQWGTLCIAFFGLLFSVYNYHASSEAKKLDNEERLINKSQQVLNLLGGIENVPYIPHNTRIRDHTKLQEIKNILDDLIIRYPKSAKVHLLYAMYWASKNRPDCESEYIQKAIKLDPNYAPAVIYLGAMYADQGKYIEAINAYNKAINIKPDIAAVYYNLGISLYKTKRYEEAYEAFKKTNQLDPDIPDVHAGLCKILSILGRYDEAIIEIKEAIKLAPDNDLLKKLLEDTQSAKQGLSE